MHLQNHEQNWQAVHGQWPANLVRYLNRKALPAGFRAEPFIHVGSVEVDVATWEEQDDGTSGWLPPLPTATIATTSDTYEVKIIRDNRLVAAIELVSPSNQDRERSRLQFLQKMEDLIQANVCLVVIDVTDRNCSFYDLFMELSTAKRYVCSFRKRGSEIDAWHSPLEIGQPISSTPLWLSNTYAIELDLQKTYVETLQDLGLA